MQARKTPGKRVLCYKPLGPVKSYRDGYDDTLAVVPLSDGLSKEERLRRVVEACERIRVQEREATARSEEEELERKREWRQKLASVPVSSSPLSLESFPFAPSVESTHLGPLIPEETMRKYRNIANKAAAFHQANEQVEKKLKEAVHRMKMKQRKARRDRIGTEQSLSEEESKEVVEPSSPKSKFRLRRIQQEGSATTTMPSLFQLYQRALNDLFALLSDPVASYGPEGTFSSYEAFRDHCSELFKEAYHARKECSDMEERVFEEVKRLVAKKGQVVASSHPVVPGQKFNHTIDCEKLNKKKLKKAEHERSRKDKTSTVMLFHPKSNIAAGDGRIGIFSEEGLCWKFQEIVDEETEREEFISRQEMENGILEEEKSQLTRNSSIEGHSSLPYSSFIPSLDMPILNKYSRLSIKYRSSVSKEAEEVEEEKQEKQRRRKGKKGKLMKEEGNESEENHNKVLDGTLLNSRPSSNETSADILRHLFRSAEKRESWGYEILLFDCKSVKEAHRIVNKAKIKVAKQEVLRATNSFGRTLLHEASFSGHVFGLKFLIQECKVDLNLALPLLGGTTAMIEAIQGHQYLSLKILLDSGADFMKSDTEGNLPMHHACRLGDLVSVKILTAMPRSECSVSFISRNKRGRRPAELVEERNQAMLVHYLKSIGAFGSYKR